VNYKFYSHHMIRYFWGNEDPSVHSQRGVVGLQGF